MPTNVVMPQMGESICEGSITKWLKNAGDFVQKDEPLFEISTDKVDAEIPSPAAGILSDVRYSTGATVEVNAVVAVIDDLSVSEHADTTVRLISAKGFASASATIINETAADERRRYSPLAQRVASENSLKLSEVQEGSPNNHITKEDVLRHLSRNEDALLTAEKLQSEATASLPGNVVPLTKMRSIIAQRMIQSTQTSPHVHTVFGVDMTRVVGMREREKAGYEQHCGVKLTYMPFIAMAAVRTLRQFPIVNASLRDDVIHYHPHINLGIAVALDWGLIVPVVKQAEERSFLDLARAIADLADRARSKRLKPDEAFGSTFTLTNSGIFGEVFGNPIINQPDSAILAIGGLKKEPVVLTDAEGNDSIAIRFVQHFCLGFDHRLIDGADAGKFMSEFKKTLENWDRKIE